MHFVQTVHFHNLFWSHRYLFWMYVANVWFVYYLRYIYTCTFYLQFAGKKNHVFTYIHIFCIQHVIVSTVSLSSTETSKDANTHDIRLVVNGI